MKDRETRAGPGTMLSALRTPEKGKGGGGDGDDGSDKRPAPVKPEEAEPSSKTEQEAAEEERIVPVVTPAPKPIPKTDVTASATPSAMAEVIPKPAVAAVAEDGEHLVLFKGDQLRKVVQYRSSVRVVRGRNKRARRFTSPPRTRRTDSKRSLPLSHAFLCVVRLLRRVASAFVFVIFWTAKRTPFKT